MPRFNLSQILTLLIVSLFASLSLADDEFHERQGISDHERVKANRSKSLTETSQDPLYKTECGSCHMVYPPNLLPARSWQALMKGLDNHFGETASLDTKTSETILQFLVSHAADHSKEKKSRKIAKSIPDTEAPLRISETPYFKKEHREIGANVWKRKSIVTPANCIACHPGAEMGRFSEREIRIPKQ